MNNAVLVGRLTADPKPYTASNGTVISNFTVAVNRFGGKEADFIDVKAFGKSAEFANEYGTKGREIAVSGRIQVEDFDGKEGERRRKTYVIADRVELLGPRGDTTAKAQATEPDDDPWADE